MSKLKADNIAKAIRQLPKPKTYQPETITVLVEKVKYIFHKEKDEWYFVA
jgi:hypothetical protein